MNKKSSAYARAAVPEYWVINPDAQTVEVLVWQDGDYSSLGLFAGSRNASFPSGA